MRRAWVAALLALGLTGCADLGYYWQSARGHVDLMRASRPVPDWLEDPATAPALKAKLELTQRIRRFAVTDLGLPDNRSYTGYSDLHRNAAVWNVVAAPPYSLKLKTWCFPVAGCVGYRGYYSDADARAEADAQRAAGLEVAVYPVPAYSTLGWLNWAGGDPLLNTFIAYPEGELARLIFHELAHQQAYAAGDTLFNESFATAVERIGGERWLRTQAGDAAGAEYAQFDGRRREFRALTLATRRKLQAVYDSPQAKAKDWPAVEVMKAEAMRDFRAAYAVLRASWPANRQAAYDGWVARANNAMFGAQAAYDDLVPAFETLYAREGSDWPRFYAEVKRLASLSAEERHLAMIPLGGPGSERGSTPRPSRDPRGANLPAQ